jgi:hypothetical protein
MPGHRTPRAYLLNRSSRSSSEHRTRHTVTARRWLGVRLGTSAGLVGLTDLGIRGTVPSCSHQRQRLHGPQSVSSVALKGGYRGEVHAREKRLQVSDRELVHDRAGDAGDEQEVAYLQHA